MSLAQQQPIQPKLPPLPAVLSLEGTLKLAPVLSLATSGVDTSVEHTGHLPVLSRAWYLPGKRSGLPYLRLEEAASPPVRQQAIYLTCLTVTQPGIGGCVAGHFVRHDTHFRSHTYSM